MTHSLSASYEELKLLQLLACVDRFSSDVVSKLCRVELSAAYRHPLLFAGLGFCYFLDGASINGFQTLFFCLHLLLADGNWGPAT